MLKTLTYIVVVVVGIYIILQIPFVKEFATELQNDAIEKRDNVVEEYNRVKDKVDGVTEKVIETKEKVEDTVDAVSDAVDTVSETADKIGDLVGVGDDEEDITVTCTEEEKAAEMCTMDYTPVCGDDEVTYGNKCQACASGKIDTYTMGECKTEAE
jgi:archaellum component FlaC